MIHFEPKMTKMSLFGTFWSFLTLATVVVLFQQRRKTRQIFTEVHKNRVYRFVCPKIAILAIFGFLQQSLF